MKFRNTFLLLAILLFCQHSYSQIKVEEYTLSNGMKVILNENHEKPEVYGAVVVKAGGKDDPSDATGMAHYMEHMLFKGTELLGTTNWEAEKPLIDSIFMLYDVLGQQTEQSVRDSVQKKINEVSLRAAEYAIPNEFDALLRSIGSTGINAGTGPDNTMYHNMFPPSQIEKWLEIYAHRFHKPVFRSFQSELEVVYEEKNMYNDMFQEPLIEEFNRNFFKNHPYGQQTIIGTVDDLKNPSLSKMKEFFDTWYAPNNMALVLVGDFEIDKVKPLIEKSFSILESKEIPEHKKYKEDPFNGRELVEVRMSPIKIGLLGFRTVEPNHKDKEALDVCNYMLTNYGQTGLIDKLVVDNKIMMAQMVDFGYNDHGASLLIFLPKIVGQKLDAAEELILEKIAKLHSGDFDNTLLEIAKLELYKEQMLSLEKNMWRGNMFSDGWARGESIDDILQYPKNIMKITKEDIIRVAKQYYGDNYLAFHSKMGVHKPEKLEKPGYKPLKVNTDAKSNFAKHFESIESITPKSRFVDFEKDVAQSMLKNGSKIFVSKNPQNDIFKLSLRYGIGKEKNPELAQVSMILGYAGAGEYSVDSLKQTLAIMGCNLDVWADKSYVYYDLEGLEKNLENAVSLLSKLIKNPTIEEDKLSIILDEAKSERKFEKSEVDIKAEALNAYALYGNKSDFLNRLSVKEVKDLTISELIESAQKATSYELNVFYSGTKTEKEISDLLNTKLVLKENPQKSNSPSYIETNKYTENQVFFIDVKKATQSKIYFYINGKSYEKKEQPVYNAFNFYFAGSFSGLVLQEVREYRSLAYSAGARYIVPFREGEKSRFLGYIGTQADKTIEALETFNGLVREMPEKSERMDNIKTYLYQQSLSSRPDFRELPKTFASWQQKGFTSDPNKILSEKYQELEFKDIVDFEAEHLKNEPMVICIAGDKSKVDMDELAKYGKITFVKEKEIFK